MILDPYINISCRNTKLDGCNANSTQYMFVQTGAARQPIDVITMNIYFTGISNGKLGRASAMSIILFMIMLIFTYLQFKLSKTDDIEY